MAKKDFKEEIIKAEPKSGTVTVNFPKVWYYHGMAFEGIKTFPAGDPMLKRAFGKYTEVK